MNEYRVSHDKEFGLISKKIKVLPRKFYSVKIDVIGTKGNKNSSYIAIFFFDVNNKEIVRRIRYISDFSEKQKKYFITAIAPYGSEYAKIGLQANTPILTEPSDIKIKFSNIDDYVLEEKEVAAESYDNPFNYIEYWKKIDKEFQKGTGPPTKNEYDSLASEKLQIIEEYGFNSNTKILDVGCGTGALVEKIKDKILSPKNYVGIDIATEPITYCKESFSDFEFLLCEKTSLPKFDKKFDMIVLFAVLMHLTPNEIGKLFRAFNEILNHNGIIICTVRLTDIVPFYTGVRSDFEINKEFFYKILNSVGFKKIIQRVNRYGENTKFPHHVFCISR